MVNDSKVIRQYLQRYAEAEAQSAAGANLAANVFTTTSSDRAETDVLTKVSDAYRYALVVPAFNEETSSIDNLLSLINKQPRVLTIVVVNSPNNSNPLAHSQTQQLLETLKSRPDTLLVDRTTPGRRLDPKKAVGLARKIGTDIAIQLYLQGKVLSPWIFQSDADAILPEHYFSAFNPSLSPGICLFEHVHRGTTELLQQAADLYDLHMRYYANGLKTAGSSYAYVVLGSAMCVHAETYCMVRGFPQRAAGEDFYLANKVAKIAAVHNVRDICISVAGRLSSRVPFGTGPALAKIQEALTRDPSGHAYKSYNPQCFTALKSVLHYQEEVVNGRKVRTQEIPKHLASLGYEHFASTVLQRYTHPKQRHLMSTQWFDALKTLRYIHHAQRQFPDISLLETLTNHPHNKH